MGERVAVLRAPTRDQDGLRVGAGTPILGAVTRDNDVPTGGVMIIDHVGLAVSNYERSKTFFSQALAPLGIEVVMEIQGWAGLGRAGKPEFWFGQHVAPQRPMHIAFAAQTREQVRAFHEAGLRAGGRDNGPPGIREVYHPNYYGAFVIGPDGHNIEAVCHSPAPVAWPSAR